MPPRFLGRYRPASARLVAWDYAAPGFYFVTWCTAHRHAVLGAVDAAGMGLSPLGALVADHLLLLPQRRPVSVEAFVVMPDHVHLLVGLPGGVGLAEVIGALKAGAARESRQAGLWSPAPLWQTRFWDRVVRDEAEAHRSRAYIVDNPRRWHARRAGETPVS